jgi:hypothetical protein
VQLALRAIESLNLTPHPQLTSSNNITLDDSPVDGLIPPALAALLPEPVLGAAAIAKAALASLSPKEALGVVATWYRTLPRAQQEALVAALGANERDQSAISRRRPSRRSRKSEINPHPPLERISLPGPIVRGFSTSEV